MVRQIMIDEFEQKLLLVIIAQNIWAKSIKTEETLWPMSSVRTDPLAKSMIWDFLGCADATHESYFI